MVEMEVGEADVQLAVIPLEKSLPSSRIPEPASRISVVPSASSTSTQEVLPP